MYRIEDKSTIIEAGGLVLNTARHTLLMGDDEAELCLTEYKILKALMMNPNMVMSRDELMNYTQGRDFIAFERSIDVHISKIRTRLRPYPDFRNLIKTVWGTGYIFKEER
jgi:two-component system phosphate regulon response regulator OmpR